MKTQNLKFGESVKYLANLAGMRPYTFSKEDEIREEKWNKYKLIFTKYVEFYHKDLFKNPSAKNAKAYLKNRNLTIDEVKKFKIGYVSNDEKFKQNLFKEFSENEIKDTGLFYFDENKKKYVDRFRDRVIFPINNLSLIHIDAADD